MEFLVLLYNGIESRVIRLFSWLDLDFYEVGLVFCVLSFAYIVYRLDHSDKAAEFHFEDLFTHGDRVGKADLFKLTAFGCFMAHTWIVVRFAAYKELSEGNLTTYALLWSGAYVVLKGFQTFSGRALLPPPQKEDEEQKPSVPGESK